MMNTEILERIKSRGYWRINFEPRVYSEKFESLTKAKDAVVNNTVELRGWDYPHIPRGRNEDQGLAPGSKYYEGWVNWFNHIELWRIYQSGQFLHYLALRDDWMEFSGWGITKNREDIKPGSIINITGELTYELTEIFEFLSRLTKQGTYDEGVKVSISLNKTKGRKLAILDPSRFPLMQEYKTSAETLDFVREYSKEELLTKPKDLAFDAIMWFFDHFGWENPSGEVIRKDQDKLLSGSF